MIPKGFRFAAVEAAVKRPGRLDLGAILCDTEATVAGAFTRNQVVAAPVLLCRERMPRGTARAILVNSGNANACTGEPGLEDARALCAQAGDALGVPAEAVLPCSTGVIGLRLPVARMERAIPNLAGALGTDPDPFARCIMTTDTFPKVSHRQVPVGDDAITVYGVAKGAGMIRPDMATMLAFLLTDARVAAPLLQDLLGRAVARTFNRATVDGDTSTNDTALLLAGGAVGAEIVADSPAAGAFLEALTAVCRDLARMMVRDGEGATKLVDVRVTGAADAAAAEAIVDTIAHSPLVKTALHGEDPNWGRIAGALGRAPGYRGGPFDIWIAGVAVVKDGLGLGADAEQHAHRGMTAPEYTIEVCLREGSAAAEMVTCDLTADYVRINADYRT